MVGILPESINQSFLLAYSTKMKAITQGKVLIRLASSISTPLKSPEGLNDLQTDFDFFLVCCPKANQMQSLLQITLTTQVVKQQQIENARNHGSSRGENEGIIRCVSVSTSHLCRIVHLRSMAEQERKSWVIKVAHVQYINSRYSIQRMMMVKKKRPKEWVGRGAGRRIQQSDEEERCYSCVSNPM